MQILQTEFLKILRYQTNTKKTRRIQQNITKYNKIQHNTIRLKNMAEYTNAKNAWDTNKTKNTRSTR